MPKVMDLIPSSGSNQTWWHIPVSPAFRGKGGRTKGSGSSSATIYQYEASLDYTGPCLRTKQHTKKNLSTFLSVLRVTLGFL